MFSIVKENNLIVFVIIYLKPRYIKMAEALKNLHFRLYFVMEDNEFNRNNKKEIPMGIRIRYFKSAEEALNICKKYSPLVFHIFVEKDYETAFF